MKSLRCAIYTRKSSEEGLDQSFNSLHAQREACEAYVLSQAGEGWVPIPTEYDDGGFSGGNIERPGLRALLVDIAAGRIDIVVVYKVDRLTRSLTDFARIVEQFDAAGVSFVSVTQAFNTTNSMGRLTLNVLLSFAQFEREVTGERIRDKIAASKAKGMAMGGRPPLGYDIVDGRYAPNHDEAPIVERIFRRYREGLSVPAIIEELDADGVRAKRWVNRSGETLGGAALSKGAIQYVLTNPVYLGIVRHKEKRYENCHPAILDRALWDDVQEAIATRAYVSATEPRNVDRARFNGLVYDDRNEKMIVSEARSRGRRYQYYVSPGLGGELSGGPPSLGRIATNTLDQEIEAQVAPLLASSWAREFATGVRVRKSVVRIVLSDDRFVIHLRQDALGAEAEGACLNVADHKGVVTLTVRLRLKRRQGAIIISATRTTERALHPDRTLIRAIALARQWADRLETGDVKSIKALAKDAGHCEHYTARLLPLAYLAPDIASEIAEGRQPEALSLALLTREPLPHSWKAQRELVEKIRL